MTHKKPGQNLGSGKSANGSTQKTTPVTKDGPEEYNEDASIGGSQNGKIKAPSANAADASSASESKNHNQQKLSMGERGTVEKVIGLKSSRFGSPFAYAAYQNKHDFFKGLLAKSTRILFDQVVAESSTLRERLSSSVYLTDDGSNGLCCVLKKCESPGTDSDSDSGEESKNDDSRLRFYGFERDGDRLKLPLFVDPTSVAVHRTHVVRNVLVDSTSSSDSSSMINENDKANGLIQVHRVWNSKSGRLEYSVLNIDLDFLSINGMEVDFIAEAGPLPDFAVFELGRSSIFWWRTRAALDYMPSLKRKRESEDGDEDSSKKSKDGGGDSSKKSKDGGEDSSKKSGDGDEDSSKKAFKGNADHSPDPQVFPESKNWLDEYRHRFRLCEGRPIEYTSSITDLHPPHQLPEGDLRGIDVVLAIGAVWLGLIRAKIDFAYANSDLFSIARERRMVGMYAVKGSNHFIMPLLFHEKSQALSPESEEDAAEPLEPVFSAFQRSKEEKNQENLAAGEKTKQKDPDYKYKSSLSLEDQHAQNQKYEDGTGHFVLVIAEKVNRDESSIFKDTLTGRTRVRLRFMDSAPGSVDRTMIRRVARNIIRHSGWLGDTWPNFDAREEHWTKVLRQSGNRSGEHTVMNAWAYMLEIPLARRRDHSLGHAAYKEVRKMILVALRGQLDSLTIRAWMQHHKYAVIEPLSQLQQSQIQRSGSPNQLRNMQTVALNEDVFDEEIREMHTQEQVDNQDHANLLGAVSVPPDGATTQQSLPTSDQGPVASSSGSSTGSANVPPVLQASHPPPRSWQQSLDQGLAHHRDLQARNPRTTEDTRKPASTILLPSNMADYDVVLGIAPIWEGLKRLGRAQYDFAYAGMDVFANGGEQEGFGAVGGWSRFVMPLFLSSTKYEEIANQGKGKKKINRVGHLLLCVAELVNDDPMTVQIKVFNSATEYGSHQDVRQRVEEMIRESRWLGVDNLVIYKPYLFVTVPRQVGINTCGLHVIFNAWATMLGIPIHWGLKRRRLSQNEDDANMFIHQGLEIVNLALGGFMDSTTIQAFFNVYGYSVEQRFGDPANSVIPVNAVGMNQEKLRLTLQTRYWRSLLESARDRGDCFSNEDMAYLLDQGLDEGEAWRALTISGGNRDRAFQWHYEQDPAGEMPRPEEALSPRTPNRGESWF